MEEFNNQQTQAPDGATTGSAAPEREPWEQPPAYEPGSPVYSPEQPAKENVLAGAVGAFLFALLGGGLYFIIYQFGYIAGICGLVTVVLATFGYQLFSGKKNSLKGVIIAIVMSVAAIFIGEYMGLAYEIYKEFKTEYEITFFDAVRATPDFLAESEILASFMKDLLIGYALGALASFANIRNAIASNRRQAAAQPQQ